MLTDVGTRHSWLRRVSTLNYAVCSHSRMFQFCCSFFSVLVFGKVRLTVDRYDGASIGDPYEFPAFPGILPTKVLRSDTIHTGSCHCGSLTIATNVRLDRPTSVAAPCDCSICQTVRELLNVLQYSPNRYEQPSCVWVHPRLGQTVLAGNAANVQRYRGDRHALIFCRICGVIMAIDASNALYGIEPGNRENEEENLSDSTTIFAVNALVLPGHDAA